MSLQDFLEIKVIFISDLIERIKEIKEKRSNERVFLSDDFLEEILSQIPESARYDFKEQLAFFPNSKSWGVDTYTGYIHKGDNELYEASYQFSDSFLDSIVREVEFRRGIIEAGKLLYIHNKNGDALKFFKRAVEEREFPKEKIREAFRWAGKISLELGQKIMAMVYYAKVGIGIEELTPHEAEICLTHLENYWKSQPGFCHPCDRTDNIRTLAELASKYGFKEKAEEYYVKIRDYDSIIQLYPEQDAIRTLSIITKYEKRLLDDCINHIQDEEDRPEIIDFKSAYLKISYMHGMSKWANKLELYEKSREFKKKAAETVLVTLNFLKNLEKIEDNEYLYEGQEDNPLKQENDAFKFKFLPFGKLWESLIKSFFEEAEMFKEGAEIFENIDGYTAINFYEKIGNYEKVLFLSEKLGMFFYSRTAAEKLDLSIKKAIYGLLPE